MKYYSKYEFKRNPTSVSSYLLEGIEGESVKGVEFADYKTGELAGQKYMRMTEPRSLGMRKYFAYTFELAPSVILTSVERLQEDKTFGDARKLGLNDLILFEFEDDMQKLNVYFLKNKACTVMDKKMNFNRWLHGEKLEIA